MTKDEASSIISRAVKRAKTQPSIRSRFKINWRNNARIFPQKLRQTLVYSESFPLTTAALIGPPVYATFRLNGLFDPRNAAGGHQPMGFDQLMAMYTKYVVLGAKITVTFTASEAAYYTGDCGINIQDPGSSIPPTTDTLVESQYSTYGIYVQAGNATTRTLAVDMSKYFGVKDIVDDSALLGTSASDPSRQVYGVVWVNTHTGQAHKVNCTVKIEYDTYFLEPRNQMES